MSATSEVCKRIEKQLEENGNFYVSFNNGYFYINMKFTSSDVFEYNDYIFSVWHEKTETECEISIENSKYDKESDEIVGANFSIMFC